MLNLPIVNRNCLIWTYNYHNYKKNYVIQIKINNSYKNVYVINYNL